MPSHWAQSESTSCDSLRVKIHPCIDDNLGSPYSLITITVNCDILEVADGNAYQEA